MKRTLPLSRLTVFALATFVGAHRMAIPHRVKVRYVARVSRLLRRWRGLQACAPSPMPTVPYDITEKLARIPARRTARGATRSSFPMQTVGSRHRSPRPVSVLSICRALTRCRGPGRESSRRHRRRVRQSECRVGSRCLSRAIRAFPVHYVEWLLHQAQSKRRCQPASAGDPGGASKSTLISRWCRRLPDARSCWWRQIQLVERSRSRGSDRGQSRRELHQQ